MSAALFTDSVNGTLPSFCHIVFIDFSAFSISFWAFPGITLILSFSRENFFGWGISGFPSASTITFSSCGVFSNGSKMKNICVVGYGPTTPLLASVMPPHSSTVYII